jgi:hypothetical protein
MAKVFILGAADPEMQEIEKILQEQGQEFQYAKVDGKRCHPGNTYKADPVRFDGEIVLVECEPAGVHNFIRIDHHRPGDPGYGLGASDFWQASSLGQLCEMLNVSPSQDQVVLAAMDHCPAHASRGECPGVTAEEILERKIKEISAKLEVSQDVVRGRIAFMLERLKNASEVVIGGQSLKDLREFDNGVGYSLDLLTSQVATFNSGYGVLLSTQDREGGAKKWTVAGHASPECIEAFKSEWASAQGLTGVYGVPTRGYAGGYLPE